MTSLGRVGRILAGSVDASILSNEKEFTATSTILPNSQQAITTTIRSNSPETCQTTEKMSSNENIREPQPITSRTENNIVLQGMPPIKE